MQASECQIIFESVYRTLHRGIRLPIALEFYAYADLDHTIRRRNGRLLVRLSDIVEDAPSEVIEALAHILLSKILRKKTATYYTKLYRIYSHSPQVQAEAAHCRAIRSRRSPGGERGVHRNLQSAFARLNARYFEGQIKDLQLLWSRKRSFRRLGYYRRTFHTIVIGRVLDDPRIPDYVFEFILYHEMLHARIPSVTANGRRYDHSATFKSAEKQFEHYDTATSYLRHWPPPEILRRRAPHLSKPLRQLRLF